VLYDPFSYASNLLSGTWVMGFVLIMILAYGLLYRFYLGESRLAGLGSIVFFLAAGAVMHALAMQLIQPGSWFGWYMTADAVDTSGLRLHAFQLPRFLHFMVPAVAVTGLFLMLSGWYLQRREDAATWQETAEAIAARGARLALGATSVQAVVGFWWLLSLPAELRFSHHPLVLTGIFLGLFLIHHLYKSLRNPVAAAPWALGLTFATVLVMAANRELLRARLLVGVGWSVLDYPFRIDWGSTGLFLATFVVGLVIAGWLAAVAWQAGRTPGIYESSPFMVAWGRLCIALLVLWIVIVAGLGLTLTTWT